jgi:hypothetical protein
MSARAGHRRPLPQADGFTKPDGSVIERLHRNGIDVAMNHASTKHAGWGAFLRLWVVLAFSFVTVKLLFDLLHPGYIDLRSSTLVQLVAVPTGQAVVYWLVARRGGRA